MTLGQTHGRRTVTLRGRIPFVSATLAGLQFYLLNGGRLTANGGIGIQPSAKGVLTLGTPTVNGRAVAHPFAGWVGVGGASGTGRRAGYLITPDRTGTFRPAQPTDGRPLDVLVTPGVAAAAAPDGTVPLQIEGEPVAGHIVGVVRRFPSIVGDAVIADRQTTSTLLDSRSPGLGTTDELWLDVPSEREAATADRLDRAPFTALSVSSRAATLAKLDADPLARGALITLAGTALVALVLALVGLLLAIVGRRARRPRRALRPRGAGRRAGDDPRTPPPARAARRGVRRRRRPRARSDSLRARDLAGVRDGDGGRAGAAAPPRRRLAGAGARGDRVRRSLAVLLVGLATSLRGRAPARAAEGAV